MRFLKKKYKSIDKISHADISGYPPPDGIERIYFLYTHKTYLDKNKIISIDKIKNVSKEVFDDVGWQFYEEKGLMKNVIQFYNTSYLSGKNYNYQSSYDCHDIEFGDLDTYLHMTLSTGNRGRVKLDKTQRKKYASFIEKIVAETLK